MAKARPSLSRRPTTRLNVIPLRGMDHALPLRPLVSQEALPRVVELLRSSPTSPLGVMVGDLLPGTFSDYVRIMHPAMSDDGTKVTWQEIAAASGVTLDHAVSFRRITVPGGVPIPAGATGAWPIDRAPHAGALPGDQCRALIEVLRPYTSTSVTYLVWDGRRELLAHPEQIRVQWLGNPYLVFSGSLEDVEDVFWSGAWEAPQGWLADDGEWAVATEIDSFSTVVGGPPALIEAVLNQRGVEALRTTVEVFAVRTGEWRSS